MLVFRNKALTEPVVYKTSCNHSILTCHTSEHNTVVHFGVRRSYYTCGITNIYQQFRKKNLNCNYSPVALQNTLIKMLKCNAIVTIMFWLIAVESFLKSLLLKREFFENFRPFVQLGILVADKLAYFRDIKCLGCSNLQ